MWYNKEIGDCYEGYYRIVYAHELHPAWIFKTTLLRGLIMQFINGVEFYAITSVDDYCKWLGSREDEHREG